MKFRERLSLAVAAGFCFTGFNVRADATWLASVPDGFYNDPANWNTGAWPENAAVGTFSGNQDYTIRFPAGGFTENSVTRVNGPANGRSLVFDTTGTWWLKSGPDKWPNSWTGFAICTSGGSHYFNLEGLDATGPANAFPILLFSNALFRVDWDTAGATNTLAQGLMNLYNPGGVTRSQHVLILGAANTPCAFVIKPDAAFVGNTVRLRGNPYGYLMRIEGGNQEIWNGLVITEPGNAGQQNVSNTVHVAGGLLAVRGGTVTVGNKVDPGNFAELLIDGDGAMSVANEINVANSSSNATAAVTLRDNARLYAKEVSVAYGGRSAAATLSLADQTALSVTNNLQVGRASYATGTVDIAGHASLTVSNLLYAGTGDTGLGTVTLRGHSRTQAKLLRLGDGGGGTGVLRIQDNATLTLTDANAYAGYHTYGTGVLEVAGGTVTATNTTLQVNGRSGTVLLSGGTSTWYKIYVNADNNGASNNTNTLIVTGGEHRCVTLVQNTVGLDLGSSNRAGVADIRGGLLEAVRMIRVGLYTSGADFPSVLRVSGGLLRVTPNSSGENLINVADSAASRGRVELTGGVVETEALRGWTGSLNKGGTGRSSLLVDGGTLRAFDVRPSGTPALLETFDEAALGPAGLTLDTADYDIAVNQTFADAPDAAGLFVKTGPGTLTVKAGSAHARTVVAQGTLAVADAVGAFGRDLAVTNGATLALSETAGSLTLGTLTVGSPAGTAFLRLTHANTVIVTNALSLADAGLFFSAPANGAYTLFRVSGTLPPSALDGLTLLNPALGKSYAFALVPDGADTLVQLTVDALVLSDLVWNGSQGSAWHTPDNWSPAQVPAGGTLAMFPASAATRAVEIAAPAAATALTFDSADPYTLNGSAHLAVSAGSVSNALGVHTLAAPLNLLGTVAFPTAPGAATLLNGTLTAWPGSSVIKSGSGILAVSGDNAATFNGAWRVSGGRLRFDAPGAFGADSAEPRAVEIGAGTLAYAGPAPAAVARGVTLDAGASNITAVIETAADLALSGAFTVQNAAFVKTGPGTLALDASNRALTLSSGNGSGGVNINPTGPVALPESGDAPATAAGLAGFNVLDGTLRIVGNGINNAIVNQRHFGFVGAGLVNSLADPALELDGVRFVQGGGGLHFIVGNSVQPGATGRAPVLRLVNGARFETDTLKLGYANVAPLCSPTLIMSNAAFASSYLLQFGANEHTRPVGRLTQGSTALSSGGGQWGGGIYLVRNVDIAVSEGSVLGQTNPNGVFRFSDNRSDGELRFESGGVMRFTEFQGRNHQTVNGLNITLDDGVMEPVASLHSYSAAYDRQSVTVAAGGLTVRVPAGVRHAFHFPLTGPGRVAKTGPGELLLAEAWAWTGGATNLTADVTGDVTGGFLVEEGTLSVSNGTVRADAVIEAAPGGILNLSAAPVALAAVTGSGTVSNGILNAAYRCRVTETGNDTLALSDVTLPAPFIVEFAGQPLTNRQTLAVAAVSGTTAQNLNLAAWKGANAGPMLTASFRRAGDTVYADIRFTGGTVILLK
jgi:autotransporter-associated beta strand protein